MARRDRKEMYQNLFDGVSTIAIDFPLLEEELAQADEIIAANQWARAEGLHIIFALGLEYLKADGYLRGLDDNGDGLAEEVARLTRDLIDSQSKYAVMKFRAFTLDQAKQALEMNVTGLETENRWSGQRIWQFRADEEVLKSRVKGLEAEIQALRARIAMLEGDEPPAPPPRRGVLATIARMIRR